MDRFLEGILSGIKDEESRLLSYIHLGGNSKIVPKEAIDRSIAKGLLYNKDSLLSLSPSALSAVAEYPLFGSYKKTKPYQEAFLPFLLGSITEGYVSSDEAKSTSYYKSDFFTSLFPSLDKDASTKRALIMLESLKELNIVYKENNSLRINKESALNFMAIERESRLSYLLMPKGKKDEREKLVKSIDLLFRIRKVKKISNILMIIQGITEFDLSPYIPSLIDLGVIYEDDDGYEGYERDFGKETSGTISSDFILSNTEISKEPIYLFLKPIKADITIQWAIDKNTIKNGFSLGYMPEDILSSLRKLTDYEIPQTITSRLYDWYKAFSSLRAERALLLIADDKNERIIDNLPLMKIHILAKPAAKVYLMNPDTESEWRKILTYSGFDMLGHTQGEQFKERLSTSTFFDFEPLPKLAEKREIAFDIKREKELEAKATTPIERILIKEGILLNSDSIPAIDYIEGFYYQEKLRAINQAIVQNRMIYIETEDKADYVKPLSLLKKTEETLLSTNKGEYSVDKFWRIALLPEYLIAPPLYFLDSDSQ